MKSLILGLLASLAFTAPALATSNDPSLPPDGVNIAVVAAGKLTGQNLVTLTGDSGKSVDIRLSNCQIDWSTGDKFYLISAPGGTVLTVPVRDFQTVYRAARQDWDLTISYLSSNSKLCNVTVN